MQTNRIALTMLALLTYLLSACTPLVLPTQAAVSSQEGEMQPLPVGLDAYYVFIADGLINAAGPPADERLTRNPLIPIMVDGWFFQKEIMERSDEEIAALEAEAIAFFNERFGIEVNDPAVTFFDMSTDPALNYRAFTAGGHAFPAEGYVVKDGGWGVMVTEPEGYTLGGEFEGQHVPQFTMVAKGEYLIDMPNEPILLDWEAITPGLPSATGMVPIDCALYHAEHGKGLARGFYGINFLEDGSWQMDIRNVLTIPNNKEIK